MAEVIHTNGLQTVKTSGSDSESDFFLQINIMCPEFGQQLI